MASHSNSSRTVRVFLSSTFRDFAEERDLLVKKVFPELRRRCRERQVELVDVDLRWGITEEQAQRGEVLPICLAEIDRSRPYFMGFIGDRYGWVPEKHQYDLSLLVEQPWLDEHRGGKSVTELEMLHGVLNNPQMKDRAFFYFRNSEYSQSKGGPYLSEGPESALKLEALKDRIRTSGFPVVENYPNPEALADKVREDLWKVIDEAYPEEEVPDPLTLDRRKHEAYGASRLGLYLGGKQYFTALDAAMGAESFKPLLITGASGGGKSALIANWTKAYKEKHPQTLEIIHYLGSGADAADPVKLVTRLLQEIARITGDELKLESDPQKILDALPEWLARASSYAEREGREWLILLDGLDKLSSLRDLRWWPGFLPPRVKLVVSCLDGEVQEEARKRMKWTTLEVHPFTLKEQREFITEYLGKYRKSLKPEQVARMQEHPLSGNPLFLRTLLEELRIFGVHEELEKKITGYLESQTVDQLFAKVLERVEGDTDAKAVRAAMEAIWASRAGLAQDELLSIANLVAATWAPIHNALDEAIFESGGRIQFGHDYVRKAIEDRYLGTEELQKNAHVRIAEWFAKQEVTPRVAEELPWQWKEAGEKEKLSKCLLKREMFEACYVKDEYELLEYWVWTCLEVAEKYQKEWKSWEGEFKKEEELVMTASKLALFLGNIGNYSAFTEKLFLQSLTISKNIFGEEHPNTITIKNNFGKLLLDYGHFTEAEKYLTESLNSRSDFIGECDIETRNYLSKLYLAKKEFDLAKFRALEATNILIQIYGKNNQEYFFSINALGNISYEMFDYDQAENYYQEAIEGRKHILGERHPSTLSSRNNLANVLMNKGEYIAAEKIYKEILECSRLSLGKLHPSTLMYYHNLGILYLKNKDYNNAEIVLNAAVSGYLKIQGLSNLRTLGSLRQLSKVIYNKGDYEKVEKINRQVYEGYSSLFNPENNSVKGSFLDLVSILKKQQKNTELINLLKLYYSKSETCADTVRYELVRQEIISGNHDEARLLINEHLILHPELKQQALEDSDLQPIQEYIETI